MADDWITTTTLLHRLRDLDDEAAWRRFVERFRRPIARFAVELGVADEDAEDVAQETLLDFMKAFREGQYERDRGRLSKWLFGIAYRRAARQRRRTARDRDAVAADARLDEVADERWASTVWDRRWEAHVLRECIRQAKREFAADTFAAFETVVGKERSPAEAARELGVPIRTVYNAKHRVLKRIRELGQTFESMEGLDGLPGA